MSSKPLHLRALLAAGAIASLAACGSDKSTGPTQGPGQASIRVVAKPTTTDTVLAAPLQALVVEVRDERGGITPGVVVRFESAVPTDSTRRNERGVFVCSLSVQQCGDPYYAFSVFTTDTTDANGRAKALVRFGTLAGPTWVIVTVPEFGMRDSIGFTTMPGAPSKLVISRRDTTVLVGAKYRVGGALADRFGNPRTETVSFGTSDPGITVDAAGEVTAKATGRHYVLVVYKTLTDTAWTSVVPAGRLLAYHAYFGNEPVVAVNLDGSDLQQMGPGPGSDYGGAPRWTPAGQALFQTRDGNTTRLFFSDGSGGKRRVTPANTPLAVEMYGDVSPDGAWVYFTGGTTFNSAAWTLWRVRADGSGAEQLITDPSSGIDWRGVLSHDGTRIVYVSGRKGYAEIRILDVNTRQVTALGVPGDSPHWSPDGTRIAYVESNCCSSMALHVMNPDGSNNRVVSKVGYSYLDTSLDWTADGQWLVAKRGDTLELVNVATSEVIPLSFTHSLFQPAVR